MGIFSGEKTISVSSVVYNLAGPEESRPNFLKSLVISNVLSGTKESMGTTIPRGYLHGPAMKFKNFYHWSKVPGNYNLVGVPTADVTGDSQISTGAVASALAESGKTFWVQRAEMGRADYTNWVEQYLFANNPSMLNTAWTATINNTTTVITIKRADGTVFASFTPSNFNRNSKYVYAWYIQTAGTGSGPNVKVYIYKIGSGNAGLDALAGANTSYGDFFPFIPFRAVNLSIDTNPPVFAQVKKAFKKATGNRIADLLTQVEANPDIDDVDFGYVVFGVSLNTVNNSAKHYLYTFFEKLQASQVGGVSAYNDWKTSQDAQATVRTGWSGWNEAQSNPDDPAYGDPEPTQPAFVNPLRNSIRITSPSTDAWQYDMRLVWAYIADSSGVGLGKPGAKPDEIWLVNMGYDEVDGQVYGGDGVGWSGATGTIRIPKTRIYWQRSDNFFTYLDIIGMSHGNVIYGGQGVAIDTNEALSDPDESGFIVPLHYDTFREVGIKHASEMATACCYLVFNCYTVVKQKWYQSGVFMFLVVIAIAILSVVFTGGAGIGILGAHMAVGAAIGLTGMTAAIVGSIINAVAALVLSTFISKLATGLFGEALGGIIAAVFMILAGNVVNAIQSGSLAFDWGSLLSADNLLKITNAVGGGVAAMANAETMNLQKQWTDYSENAKAETDKIQQAFFQEFGYGAGQINPLMFVESSAKIIAESSDTFLTRTLLTGSEIAELSKDMLTNFAEYTTKLPDVYT